MLKSQYLLKLNTPFPGKELKYPKAVPDQHQIILKNLKKVFVFWL